MSIANMAFLLSVYLFDNDYWKFKHKPYKVNGLNILYKYTYISHISNTLAFIFVSLKKIQ